MSDREDFNNKSDEELIKLTFKNQENFLFIIQRYKIKLNSYIMRITNISQDEAEDILQEIFIKVYLNLNDFNFDFKFSSWIYRIARNETISHYRKDKVRPHGNSISIDEEGAKELISDFDIEKEIDQDFLRKKIVKILNNLDEKYKEILILKFFEEKSYQEISDIVKKPMGTVASLMNKAKKEFNKEMKKKYEKK